MSRGENTKESKKLTYYRAEKTLFAHGDFYDFFQSYNKESGQWETCRVSFSQFLHNFWYREISEGRLSTEAYQKYCKVFSGFKSHEKVTDAKDRLCESDCGKEILSK